MDARTWSEIVGVVCGFILGIFGIGKYVGGVNLKIKSNCKSISEISGKVESMEEVMKTFMTREEHHLGCKTITEQVVKKIDEVKTDITDRLNRQDQLRNDAATESNKERQTINKLLGIIQGQLSFLIKSDKEDNHGN